MRFTLGFSAGAAPRVAVAVAWAIIAVAIVLILDTQATSRRDPGAAPSMVTRRVADTAEGIVELQLSAGFRVAQWRVLIGPTEIEATTQDAGSWSASIEVPSHAGRFEILVEAQSEDLFADHRHALQVILRDGDRRAERTIWGDGDITVLVDVDRWLDAGRE